MMTLLLAALLPLAAAAEDVKPAITQQQAGEIAKQLAAPVIQVVKPAADKAAQDLSEAQLSANAAAWALWDLVRGLAAKNGVRPAPDCALAETYVRLRMRCNTGDLCPRHGGDCKSYPPDETLAAAARTACGQIGKFSAKLPPGEDPALRHNRTAVEGFMETARLKSAFGMPKSKTGAPKPPAPSPAEQKYRDLALKKKQGNHLTQPPWP